jgi:hypothetical protein
MHRTQKPNRSGVGGRIANLKTAIATIKAYRQSLGSLGARRDVLGSLDLAIIELERIEGSSQSQKIGKLLALSIESDPFKGNDPALLSIEETRKLVESQGINRRTLERIAIERFSVPRGSMRSYPTIDALREKLMTLIRNDFAHHTIASVSRSGSRAT